jgi:hypothetical protein
VLYIALERAQLVKRRAMAFRISSGIWDLPFAIVGTDIDMRDLRASNVIAATSKALMEATGNQTELIIIDTLSRALAGGDENSPKDMGALVRTLSRIGSITGAHVLGVHHTPVDGGARQRGHSSLKGGLDTTVHVEKGATRTATVTKANDSEEGEMIAFTLESVDIGMDEEGNVTTAPIVVSAEAPKAPPAPARKLNDRQKLALEALSNCAADRGKPPPEAYGLPTGIVVVNVNDWRDHLLDAGILDKDAPNPRQDFKRLKDQLQARHLVAERGSLVWRV